MNIHLIFQELRELKKQIFGIKQDSTNTIYNQMLIGQKTGTRNMNNIIFNSFPETERVDVNRTDALETGSGFTTQTDSDNTVFTDDFNLGGSFGDFHVFVYKDNLNLDVQVFVSNDDSGENWVESDKVSQTSADGLHQETFRLNKGRGTRVRFKFVLTKVDENEEGTFTGFNVIYQ